MEIYYAFYKAFEAKGRDYTDWIIAHWTLGPYSHVEIIVDDCMYSSSGRDGGVRRKKHTYDSSSWDYVPIEVSDDAIEKLDKFYEMTMNCKYDWLGILGFVLPVHDSENRYFCSEWCSKAGIIMDIDCLYDKNPARISPNRLSRILLKEGYGFKRIN